MIPDECELRRAGRHMGPPGGPVPKLLLHAPPADRDHGGMVGTDGVVVGGKQIKIIFERCLILEVMTLQSFLPCSNPPRSVEIPFPHGILMYKCVLCWLVHI